VAETRHAEALSDWFAPEHIVRGGSFLHLDEVESSDPGALVFCQTVRHLRTALTNPHVTCILTTRSLLPETSTGGLAVAEDPRLEFFKLYNVLRDQGRMRPFDQFGIGRDCQIHPSSIVSERVVLGARVVVGPGAVIEDYCVIGDDTYIGSGVIIGAEGLFTLNDGLRPLRIAHAGHVVVGANVTILSGSVVARSLYRSPTRIGDGTRIAILTNIGHGVTIGDRCVVSGNCVVAGRAVIEDEVWIGASCSIAQGLHIGRKAHINMGSVVIQHVKGDTSVSGNFAIPHSMHVKNYLRGRG
jgi:UDP-3-O-[3-hydroxymyristoyl] glucosamine N-acyltransferase